MSPVLPKTWKVPEVFHARLGEQAGHQRSMAADGDLLLILHKIPEPGNPDRVPVIFWRDSTGAWKTSVGGSGVAVLKSHLDDFGTLIDKLEERMQAAPNADTYFDILQHTGPLLRTARNTHLALQQAREAIPDDRTIIVARDRAGELERGIELLHADAKNGMEYMVAKQAEEQARNSEQLLVAGHRLNLLIAIFLPLTALGSAFGMNMRHGLEWITSPFLFWGTLLAGILLGFFVKALLNSPPGRTARTAALLAFIAAGGLSLSGAETPIKLWPQGSPGDTAKLETEKDLTKDSEGFVGGRRLIRLGNVSDPTITLYPAPAAQANGAAILVCPGGAYNILALDLEGTEVCERLNSMGITAVLLKYRVPRRPDREKHAAPLQDAQRALGLIRQHAAEWKVDPKRIGILGFSAGGHLAAAASTASLEPRTYPRIDEADDLSARPNFTVLIYPGYLTPDKDGTKLSPELNVDKDTPQAFIAMTADDPVRADNALAYAAALGREKIPYALHIYPTGGHGYGLRPSSEPVTTWPDRFQEWFRSRSLDKE